jgi:hypothetical protein
LNFKQAWHIIAEKHGKMKTAWQRPVLDELAHLLSQKESVQGKDLRKMLSESKREGESLTTVDRIASKTG